MSFNRRDLEDDDDFNFDDDNSFNFDDDDGFQFDDDPGSANLDDDAGGFGFEDEDMPDIEEDDGDSGGGVSRTFIVIAGILILLFVLGLAGVLFIATQNNGPTDIDMTATSIVATNQSVETVVAQRATDSVLEATRQAEIANQTATAEFINNQAAGTATAEFLTQEANLAATQTAASNATPTLDPTQQAFFDLQTQTAVAAEATANFLLTPATQPPTQEINAEGVSLTATALAELLAPPTADPGIGGGGVPTQEVLQTPGIIPTALPETGFFDDLATSGGGMGALALMAVGLVGVIFLSRRLRTATK